MVPNKHLKSYLKGADIGIVTNKGRHGLNKMLERHNITALINVSLTADDVSGKASTRYGDCGH